MKCFLVAIKTDTHCTPSSPCDEGYGDCDNDSDCKGSLGGGDGHGDADNCRDFHPRADSGADCCIKP